MNATQEILDALYRLDVPRKNPRLERAIHDNTDDIRAILETHELVPVDQHAEMQRLLLPYAGLKLRDGEVMPVDGEGLVECLTRVLQAFEALRTPVIPPIDSRPFDPTLCGFEPLYEGAWGAALPNVAFTIKKRHSWCEAWQEESEERGAEKTCDCPWPATQSDGETLLRLLGVLG